MSSVFSLLCCSNAYCSAFCLLCSDISKPFTGTAESEVKTCQAEGLWLWWEGLGKVQIDVESCSWNVSCIFSTSSVFTPGMHRSVHCVSLTVIICEWLLSCTDKLLQSCIEYEIGYWVQHVPNPLNCEPARLLYTVSPRLTHFNAPYSGFYIYLLCKAIKTHSTQMQIFIYFFHYLFFTLQIFNLAGCMQPMAACTSWHQSKPWAH